MVALAKHRRHTKSSGRAVAACRYCGAPIGAASHARDGDGYCCEGCFLAERRYRALAAGADDPASVLAEALVAALDVREHEIGLHSKRVACYTLTLARHSTDDAQQPRQVYWGALLHDIGKIGIPGCILQKRESLNSDEWRIMRAHPEVGHRILLSAPFMAGAAEIVLNHEERFDGSGASLCCRKNNSAPNGRT